MSINEERALHVVSDDEPADPLDDLEEFIDASATYGESGLREELTEVPQGHQEPGGPGSNERVVMSYDIGDGWASQGR